MKKFLALVLALVMTMSLVTVSASAKTDFTDDAKINNAEAVEVLNAMGVLTGYADGSFRPQGVLTRGAGAKLIAYLVLGQTKADKLSATYTVFKDVTDSVGLAAYIEWAAANGIVDGYGDGNFGPYNTLTEYAFGKMLLTALGYDSAKEGYVGAGWQKSVYTEAVRNGIFDGTETYGACTRETAARMALGALQANIVAYGTQTVGGKYVWNGHQLTASDYYANVEGAVKLNKTLAEFYGLKQDPAHDIFARPGHTWTYGTWTKFYMDAPVAYYTDKVDTCDILVDLGVAKTSNGSAKISHYVDGVVADSGTFSHKNCGDKWGGKGTLTEVFAVYGADGKLTGYDVTEVHTYLAKVTYVDKAAHSRDLDESNITFFGWDRNGNKELCLEGALLTKGEYVLVQLGKYGYDENNAAAKPFTFDDDYLTYNKQSFYGHTRVLGAAQSFEGKATAYTNRETLNLTVAGSTYPAAEEYNTSYVFSADSVEALTAGMKKNAVWFLDQYGNIIGDVAPASAAPVYGVVDAIKWVNDGPVNTAEYASANLVKADAKQEVINAYSWNTALSFTAGVPSVAKATVSDNQAENGIAVSNSVYFANDNNYGVVAYTVNTDGSYSMVTAGAVTGEKAIVKGQSWLGGSYALDDETVFLVRTTDAYGKAVYTQYVGFNNVPTMSSLTDIVACYDDYATSPYVDFAFVIADNAVYPGSTTEAYVLKNAYQGYDAATGLYTYEVWVNGAKTEIKSAVANLFGENGCNACELYKVTFNASGYATTAALPNDYKHDLTVTYVGANTADTLNTAVAKIYLVGAAEVTEVAASEIKAGDTLCYSVDETVVANNVAKTIYIVGRAGNPNGITKPLGNLA